MSKTEPRICGLVRWHAKKSDACARAINISFAPELTRRFGRIQGVFAAPIAPKLADTIIAHLEDAFTRGALEAERRRGPEAPQELLLEDAVAITNQAISRLFGEHGLPLDPRQASGLVMAVKDSDVILAVWGSPEILLYRFPAGEGRVKIFNLLTDETAAPKGKTGFTSVISGQLNLGDRLMCATRSVRDIIGPEKMENAMRQDPGGAIEVMREALAEANDAAAIAVLAADITEMRYVEDDPCKIIGQKTRASVEAMEKTVGLTNEVLSPSLASSLKGAAKTVAGGVRDSVETLTAKAAETIKQKREEAQRRAQEQAAAEEEARKKPKWLRPGDKVVGEGKVEVQGKSYSYPLLDLETTEIDVRQLADEERRKTAKHWSGSEAAPPDQDQTGSSDTDEPLLPEGAADIRPEPDGEETIPPEKSAEPKAPPPAPADSLPQAEQEEEAAAPAAAPALDLAEAPTSETLTEPPAPAGPPPAIPPSEPQPEEAAAGPSAAPAKRFALSWTPLTKKAAIGAVVGVLVIAAVYLVTDRLGKKRAEERQARERLIETIRQNIDSAEASLIYKNDERAGQLLNEAAAALNGLQPTNSQEEQLRTELAKRIESERGTLRKEVPLGQPESVINVTALAEGANLSRVQPGGAGLLWLAGDNGSLLLLKGKDTTPTAEGQVAGNEGPTALAATGSGAWALTREGLALFVSNGGQTTSHKLPDATTAVTDAAIYNGRLYVLDAPHNRIQRHSPAAPAGWGDPQPYLSDGTDVSGAVSMAIDSAVYLLKTDGSLIKLFKGVRAEFRPAAVQPPLTAAARVLAPDGDILYVLDPTRGRLISFSKKDGGLLAQYLADGLKGASDVAVDAQGGVLTVANGQRLLKYGLPK